MRLNPFLVCAACLANTAAAAGQTSFLCLPGDNGTGMRLVPYECREGDIILFQTSNRLLNAVFRLTGAGPPTHCGIVVRRPDGSLGLLEAPHQRELVTINPLPERLRCYQGRVWVRTIRQPLTPEQSQRLTAFAVAQEGKPFARLRTLVAAVAPPGRRSPAEHAAPPRFERQKWFCSELVVAAGITAGLFDPRVIRPTTTNPRDLSFDEHIDLSPRWHKPLPWISRPSVTTAAPQSARQSTDRVDRTFCIR